MDGLLRCRSRGGRPTTRPVPPDEAARAGTCQPGRLPVYGLEPLHQLDPGPLRALVPGRRGPRAQDSSLHTLERGRHGHAGEHTRSRHRRPPLDFCELSLSLRSRLQPFLPGQGQRHGRRPGVLPGSRVTRHLCPRVRRGPARGTTSWTTTVSKSAARACPVTRTLALCPPGGSSRRCQWGSAPSRPSTRRASIATSCTESSRTRRSHGCGPSSGTVSSTSRRRGPRSAWQPVNAWTTSPSSSTATFNAWMARSGATARSSRSWRRCCGDADGT